MYLCICIANSDILQYLMTTGLGTFYELSYLVVEGKGHITYDTSLYNIFCDLTETIKEHQFFLLTCISFFCRTLVVKCILIN